MAELPFDLEAFIEGVNRDRSVEKGTNDRIKRMLMNVKQNQGTVTLVPFISKTIGNIYAKVERVREFNAPTTLLDDTPDAWYKILPIEKYVGITPEQTELYNEVVGLYDAVFDWEYFDYDRIRKRNYSLFTGILIGQTDTDGNPVEDNIDSAVLLVYPSNSPIDALNTAISNKRTVLKDKTLAWLQQIITPELKGRKGVMMITFKKNDGPGYGSTINFETNSEFNVVIDPAREFSQEIVSKFDDPIKTFLGWCYDHDHGTYFNETLFRELRDQLKLALKECEDNGGDDGTESADPANKNGAVDPMNRPPVPGVDPAPQPQASASPSPRPF